jgi:hypothetical protein
VSTANAPGSLRRAVLGWRAAASLMLPLWAPLPFLAEWASRSTDGFEDLAFVTLMLIAYVVAVLFLIPAFALTIGRWVDRRTAPLGLRRATVIFGIWGFGFGLALALVLGVSALTPLGIAVVLLVPALAAAGARLLLELRGLAWEIILWAMFALANAVALAFVMTVFFRS